MECPGNTADHCCHLGGRVCVHLEENTVPGRRWACALYRAHGSWDAVHSAEEYSPIRERLRNIGIPVDCGDWPRPGEKCHTCGGTG